MKINASDLLLVTLSFISFALTIVQIHRWVTEWKKENALLQEEQNAEVDEEEDETEEWYESEEELWEEGGD